MIKGIQLAFLSEKTNWQKEFAECYKEQEN